MDPAKQKRLEAAGWKVGTVQEFLGLTDGEMKLIEHRVDIARKIRARRVELGMTQVQLAALVGTTQPRVARIEVAAPDVSLDVLMQAYFALNSSITKVNTMPRRRPAQRAKRAVKAAEATPKRKTSLPAKRRKAPFTPV